jgi:hypothetical protein
MKNSQKPHKKIPLWVSVGLLIFAGILLKYMFKEIKYVRKIYKVEQTINDAFNI